MKRSITSFIVKDLPKKLILVSGPRQCGKTTLGRSLYPKNHEYVNYDIPEDRALLKDKSWRRDTKLVVFDELHKLKQWKSWLKGLYDAEGVSPPILVTGSAKMDTYRKVGDSLAGRYFPFRLHPFDVKELTENAVPPAEALEQLLITGGFPEPYLEGSQQYYNRWRRTHLDIILRQDLIALENVREITQIETLIELLKRRVGSTISYSSLARDLSVSDKTIKHWLTSLESLFVVFRVPSFHRNIARALEKSGKYYFYDTGLITGDAGSRFENLVACALLKEIEFRQDCLGEEWQLCFLRTKDQKEVDFALAQSGELKVLIEAKLSDDDLHPHLKYFCDRMNDIKGIQLVSNSRKEKAYMPNMSVREAAGWLAEMDWGKG